MNRTSLNRVQPASAEPTNGSATGRLKSQFSRGGFTIPVS
jgi:hypothetical protein